MCVLLYVKFHYYTALLGILVYELHELLINEQIKMCVRSRRAVEIIYSFMLLWMVSNWYPARLI